MEHLCLAYDEETRSFSSADSPQNAICLIRLTTTFGRRRVSLPLDVSSDWLGRAISGAGCWPLRAAVPPRLTDSTALTL